VFMQNPNAALVFGTIQIILDGVPHEIDYPVSLERMLEKLVLPFQPASFFSRHALDRLGALNPRFHYIMDADLLLRLLANFDSVFVPVALATFNIHPGSKTSIAEEKFAEELLLLLEEILAHPEQFPRLSRLGTNRVKSIFYRRASKHFYMGNHFAKSLRHIAYALQTYPSSTLEILMDEGVGWLARRLVSPATYRRLSAWVRSYR